MNGEFQKCCRICLDADSEKMSILEDSTVHLHLKSCLAITVSPNDDLPKMICGTCVSQLSEFYNFQLNARCSQDWLESSLQERSKKALEKPTLVQPLPDSEYNSDSLLEFLNNTANIEEYLNNLGKEDIPSIVNMLDRNNENSMDCLSKTPSKSTKQTSPKKKEAASKVKSNKMKMEIDVLDSDVEIVKGILLKQTEPKKPSPNKLSNTTTSCFACKTRLDNIQKLSQHVSVCDLALRTCMHCNTLFDSRQKMQEHSLSHNGSSLTCTCGKQFNSKEKMLQHHKTCHTDYSSATGCLYRCKQCQATFKDRLLMYKHAKEHVLKAEERICDICSHSFIGTEALIRHKKDMHENSKNLLFRCKVCGHSSTNYNELYLHVKKHTEATATDTHLCETCGQCYTTHASLMRHTMKHAGNAAGHSCAICKKIFTDVKLRDKHVLEHTDVTMCEKCGQSISSYKLSSHSCV